MLDLIIAFVAGFFAAGVGAMGAGGGATISFLALIQLGVPIPIAIVTTKFGDVGFYPLNLYNFYRAKKIPFGTLLTSMIVLSIIGMICGALLLVVIDKDSIEILVIVLFTALFFFLLFNNRLGLDRTKKRKGFGFVYFFTQVYSGFFSAAAGTLATLSICWFRGFRIGKAAALNFAASFLGSIFSTLVLMFALLIDYRLGVPLFLGNLPGGG